LDGDEPLLLVAGAAAAVSDGFAGLVLREGLSDVLLTLVAISLVSVGLVIVSQVEMRFDIAQAWPLLSIKGSDCNRMQSS
jgi:energy-converting hydrogenase Eha subunit C